MRSYKNSQFAVLGLGRFGGSLCREFTNLGKEVLAIDNNPELVQEYSTIVTQVIQADVMEEGMLRSLGLANFDYVVVSFGDNIQTSILTTLILKEIGVKNVWVKAHDENHHKVLEKIGADRIIHPERDMAVRIAHHIVSEKVIDYIEVSNDHSIVEIIATEKVAGKTLQQLDIRKKFGVSIIAIKRGEQVLINPSPEENVYKDDIFIVIGNNKDIHRFEEKGV